MAMSAADTAQAARLEAMFEQMGLRGVFDKAWQLYKNGADEQTILFEIRKTPEWRDRFGIAYDAMSKQGTAVSEGDIIEYERVTRGLMRQYGMPAAWQDYKVLQGAMANNVSADELRSRLVEGQQRAALQPQSVKSAYAELFGHDGHSALTATMFLEFDTALPELENRIAQAEVLGRGRGFGFNFDRSEIGAFVDQTTDSDTIKNVLGQLDQQRSLFRETLVDQADLRAEREGVQAALGTSTAGAELERRRQQRVAASRTNVGGGVTERGSLGYGSPNR